MQKYEKKAKEAKKYTQALRKVNYAYTKKNGLSSILEEFWIPEPRKLDILGPWKRKNWVKSENLQYVTVKWKHVIETIRKKAIFVKIHNFTFEKFGNTFKF